MAVRATTRTARSRCKHGGENLNPGGSTVLSSFRCPHAFCDGQDDVMKEKLLCDCGRVLVAEPYLRNKVPHDGLCDRTVGEEA